MDNSKQNSIEDHDYDGIKELNNNPPPWIMWVFYLTIVFALCYVGYYNFYKHFSQYKEYAIEMATVNKASIVTVDKPFEEKDIVVLNSPEDLNAGKALFTEKNCVTCHGNNGQGNIGPNLTDNYWIHGNTVKDLHSIIKNGNLSKGMLSFKDQLSDKQILQLASFVLVKLKGTNPPNAKAPQGKLYE